MKGCDMELSQFWAFPPTTLKSTQSDWLPTTPACHNTLPGFFGTASQVSLWLFLKMYIFSQPSTTWSLQIGAWNLFSILSNPGKCLRSSLWCLVPWELAVPWGTFLGSPRPSSSSSPSLHVGSLHCVFWETLPADIFTASAFPLVLPSYSSGGISMLRVCLRPLAAPFLSGTPLLVA